MLSLMMSLTGVLEGERETFVNLCRWCSASCRNCDSTCNAELSSFCSSRFLNLYLTSAFAVICWLVTDWQILIFSAVSTYRKCLFNDLLKLRDRKTHKYLEWKVQYCFYLFKEAKYKNIFTHPQLFFWWLKESCIHYFPL